MSTTLTAAVNGVGKVPKHGTEVNRRTVFGTVEIGIEWTKF